MIISAPRLFLDGAFSGPGAVRVEDGRIVEVLAGVVAGDVVLADGFLAPGLIDLHNNGAFGVDCATATPGEWDYFIGGLASRGVTSVLPTVITAPVAEMVRAAAGVAAAMARHQAILGVHLEGPFLSPEKPGAHRPDWIAVPDAESVKALAAAPGVRVVTLAPEIPGALEAIRTFVVAGITVALGHTNATAAQILAGVAAGARVVTHVFTAQSGLHQRAPGAVGVALTDEGLWPCIIVDGVHVDPVVLKLAFAACPRLVAVTDSICIAGLPEGAERDFGGMPARVVGGVGRRPDGTIAGAAVTLDEGVRRMIAAGIAPAVAFAAATCRPADALRLSDRGRIVPGARADLVWWGDDLAVRQVWTAGQAGPALPCVVRGTETVRADLDDLETRAMPAIVGAFLAQEAAGQAVLRRAAGAIAALADAVAARLQAGGRLFYVGAGTSGRLALLDAVECGPTFGVAEGLIVPILAGGDGAFLRAVEGAEDDAAAAAAALTAHGVCAGDAVVGIAASGATPFTLAAIRYATGVGALTGAIVNNAGSPMAAAAEMAVEVLTGPEVIAGSTRLSAGTAQKIALNTLSSCVMIKLGKTYGPFMVDVRASNAKLRARAVRMVAVIAKVAADEAEATLVAADWEVKTAVVMMRLGVGADEARERLRAAGGRLRAAVAGDGRRGWSGQARP
jgi:N-acetylmuramic acid 6-phosphate etherase/N-acetylglucosamine-6-phosphate deacetylase